ncbi:urease accessory protein UreE [Rhodobacter sp. TJ_12]|uniref:urease accessory protein UreE n=1 Tax=Rhodobacter sp. TJ_12 TaxID=2029399 RepID=UPI001CBC65C5|nr:urease accessory protein UreE [Rhodobacter sp. TJ_12]MBZ4021977.1 urease accessory protein UreE [Rhodobacter sp. TJ_12]
MTITQRATKVVPAGSWSEAADHVALDYEARFLRRKRLVAASGVDFLVDLPEVVNLTGGEAFALEDGRFIEVRCGLEPVLVITGDLTRLAWHIGNRHTPCQIETGRLVIRDDHVLEAMLKGLGAKVEKRMEPFRPESGAYGTGRTMGHDHGGHDHGHSHAHGHGGFHVHA